jgi:hypothetical protein
MTRADLTEKLLDIKREKGWSWKQICSEIGRDHRATLTFYAPGGSPSSGAASASSTAPVSPSRAIVSSRSQINRVTGTSRRLASGRSLTMSAWSISTTVGGRHPSLGFAMLMSSPEELPTYRHTALGEHKTQRPSHRTVARPPTVAKDGRNAAQEMVARSRCDQRSGRCAGRRLPALT